MKVAITGATGFVGSNLKAYLHKRKNYELLEVSRTANLEKKEIITYNQFLLNDAAYDAIIHLAGKAHDLKNTSLPEEYFAANYELTRKLFEGFVESKASIFVYMSSVKAVSDMPDGPVTEQTAPEPVTAYGQSKLKAEQYLESIKLPRGKKVYILRPCMIHGPGNKGNLNLLTGLVKRNIPYPLGAFENKRSFLSVENLCFIIEEILKGTVVAGIYNVADDTPVSTNELIKLIGEVLDKKPSIWKINKQLISFAARIGDKVRLPLNSEALQKLTTDYIVSNNRIVEALGKPLPLGCKEGLVLTLKSFR